MDAEEQQQTTGLFCWWARISRYALRENTVLFDLFAEDALNSVERKLALVENDGRKREISWITSPNKPVIAQDERGFIEDTHVIRHDFFVGFVSWEQALPGEHVSFKALEEWNKTAPVGQTITVWKPQKQEKVIPIDQLLTRRIELPDLFIEPNDVYYFRRVRGGWQRVGSVELYGPPTYEQYWLGITPHIEVIPNVEAGPTDIEITSEEEF